MSGYKCTKCGETAYSKCVRQRSVFTNGGMLATMISNCVTIDAVRRGSVKENWRREEDSDKWNVTMTFEVIATAQDEMEAIDKAGLHEFLTLDEKTARSVACIHRWEITEGECMFGCCKA